MILRRVSEHVRAQNWAAITIEFVLVVLGVFLGIQVSNWNEARNIRAGEHTFLARLATDLSVDIASEREKTEFMEATGAAGLRSLAFLAGDQSCGTRCWPIIVDLFAASQWRDLSQSRVTLDELRGSPYPYDDGLKRDLIDHYLFIREADQAIDKPEYRTLIRSLIPATVQETLWRDCFAIDGARQRIRFDCESPLDDEEARTIVAAIRGEQDVTRSLTFYASMVKAVARTMRAEIPHSEALLARVRARAAPPS